jgi:hypothetical protein
MSKHSMFELQKKVLLSLQVYQNIWIHVWTISGTGSYWLLRREIVVSFSDEKRDFCLFQSIQIGCGFRPVSTGCAFLGGKVAGPLNWRLTSTIPVCLHGLHGELSLRISSTHEVERKSFLSLDQLYFDHALGVALDFGPICISSFQND